MTRAGDPADSGVEAPQHHPTRVPTTQVPPTDVPPTKEPPTDVPPTKEPPTDIPPTEVPPTKEPPTEIPPTDVPPTKEPTRIPPTDIPPSLTPSYTPTFLPTNIPTLVPTATAPIPYRPTLDLVGILVRGTSDRDSAQKTQRTTSRVPLVEQTGLSDATPDQLIWETTLVNEGQLDGVNQAFVVQIPDTLTIVNVALNEGTYAFNGNEITVYLPVVVPGQSYRAIITTEVAEMPADGRFVSRAQLIGYDDVRDTAFIQLEVAEARELPQALPEGPEPTVDGAPVIEEFAGMQTCWVESFINLGTDAGYGPYIILILDPDLTFDSASFIGTGISPFFTGTFVGTTLNDPISGEPITAPVGSTMIVLKYPVGSVVTGGPPLLMELCVTTSPTAEINVPNPIDVYGGYEFGNTPTNENGPILNPVADSGSITPILVEFEKRNTTPEGERPPGPIWSYDYILEIELAPGQTLTGTTFEDALSDYWQYTGPTVVSGTCTTTGQVITNPSTSIPGGTLAVNHATIVNPSATDTCLLTVTFTGYIIDILTEADNTTPIEAIINNASFNYSWEGNPGPESTDTNTVSAENMVFQKSANPTVVDPGEVVNYAVVAEITEYGNIQQATIIDTMPDGMDYNAGSGSFTSPDFGTVPITPAIVTSFDGTLTLTFDLTAASGGGVFTLGGTVTLTYSGTVRQTYRATGEDVRADDQLPNTVVGIFDLVEGGSFTNSSGANVIVERVELQKATISTPANGEGFVHGEPVRFRLTLEIPSGDAQSIIITDFFPLPVFSVADADFGLNAVAGTLPVYNSTGVCAGYPAGQICGIERGPADNSGLSPTSITVNAAQNSIAIAFPNVSGTIPKTLQIDIIIAVVDRPFTDGLYLSNIAQAQYTNTAGAVVTADAISYLAISAPSIALTKGVSDSTNPDANIAPITDPIDGDLTDGDAGDVVEYVITASNSGGAAAYNVRFTDPVPAGLSGCVIVSVENGAGTALTYTGDLFTGTLILDNPLPGLPEIPTPADINAATVLITYTCIIDGTVEPETLITNTATVQFDPLDIPGAVPYPLQDEEASVQIVEADIAKSVAPTTATIGQVVTYTVTVDIPGGVVSDATVVDTLPAGMAFVDCLSVVLEPGLTTSFAGSLCADPVNPTVGAGGGTVTWDFDTLTSSGSANNDFKTITLTYTAVVLNQAAVNRGDALTNSARLFSGADSIAGPASATVTVIEPTLQIDKTASPDVDVDSSDTVTFTLVISHAPGSNATAHNVTMSDVIPPGLSYVGGSLTHTAGVAPDGGTLLESGGVISAAYTSLTVGQTSTITFQVTLDAGAPVGDTITNTAFVEWTSLPGSPTNTPYNPLGVERTGDPTDPGGAANTYVDSDPALLDISDPTSLKEVFSTSHPGTGNGADTEPDLTIGEEVTYRLTFTFPEGVTTNVRMVDLLPVASASSPVTLEYVSHALVSFGANLTPAVLPAPTVNDRDGDGSNDRVIWMLGTITNAPDNTIDAADRIVIDVTARVRNLPDNIGLVTNRDLNLVNISRITYTIGGVDTTVEGSATVDLVEPQLQIDKVVSPTTTVDAGQLLTYTLTISHTGQSTANAYDVSIADTMPTVFSAPVFIPASSTCDERTGWALSFTAPTAAYSFDNLLLGESCTIVYTTIVQNTAAARGAYVNTAVVTSSSLPGTPPDDRTTTANDTVTVNIAEPTVVKTVTSTSLADTTNTIDGADQDLAIGEEVTYTITYTFPEGTIRNVRLIDQLPPVPTPGEATLVYVSSSITSIGANLTVTTPGAVAVVTDSNTDTYNDTVTYTIGDVVNAFDNSVPATAADQITMTVTARVVNIASNVGVVTGADNNATNRGRITYWQGATGTTNRNIDATADIDVVEPRLTIAKTDDAVTVDAGAVVTYTLTIDHDAAQSRAPAYDIVITDTLPNNAGTAVVSAPTLVPAASTCDEQAGWATSYTAPTATFSFDRLLLAEDCTIVYTVTVNDLAFASATYNNSARIASYTTLPGVDPNERIEPPVGPVTSSFNTPSPSLVKSVTATSLASTTGNNLAIGEEVTYTIVYTFPEGTTRTVSLIDNLPRIDNEGASLAFVSANITAVGAGITAPAFTLPQAAVLSDSPSDADTVNDTATWTLGNVVSTGDNVANSTITVTVVARVLDVAGNVGVVTGQDINLTNTGTLTYQNGAGVTQTLTSSADVNIVEPRLNLTKTDNATVVDAGDTVTYTLTLSHTAQSLAAAYDISITDVLPNNAGTAVVTAPVIDTAASTCDDGRTLGVTFANPNATFTLNQLLLGDTCTIVYTVVVNDLAFANATYTNSATAVYTTLPGVDPNERIEPPVGPVTSSFNTPSPSLDKTVAGSGSFTIGEEVTYTIVYTFPEGTTRTVSVIDNLPRIDNEGASLAFVSANITAVGAGITAPAFTLPQAAVLSDSPSDADAVNDTATWTLGNVVSTGDNIANSTITVTVVALVRDIPQNVGLVTGQDINITNTGTLTYQDGAGVTQTLTDTADINIVEPRLNLTKTDNATVVDAGDTVTYTLTLSHTAQSLAPAYDISITDVLPNNAGTAVVNAPVIDTAASTCDDGRTLNVTFANPNATFTLNELLLGDTCTIVYTVVVNDLAFANATYNNSATAVYTTLPGVDPNERIEPPIGPVTSSFDTPDPSLNKTVAGSGSFTIGEEVTYTIVYTFPEGTTRTVSLIDNLPRIDNEGASLAFVSANITAVGAGITAPTITLPQAAVLSDSPSDADAVNDTATWTLGNVVSTGDNVANSTITVTVVALVRDILQNVGLVTGQDINITNTGTLTYQDGAGVTQTLTDTADITLVEPQVALTKTNSTPTTTVEIGGEVTYTLTLDHTAQSTANAYDLTITDVLPTEGGAVVVNYTTFDAAASTCDDGGRTLTDSYAAPTVTFTLSSLDLPDTCTIVYTVIVNADAEEGETYSNLAQVASVTTIPGSDPDERIEPPTPTDSTDFTVGSATIDKIVSATSEPSTGSGSDADADLTIGEEVTYTVTVTMPDGVRNAVTVRDDLPVAGVQFEFVSATLTGIGADLSGAGLVIGTAGVLSDEAGAVGVNDRATWALGTVTNATDTGGTVAADNQLVFVIVARVSDVPANVGLLPSPDINAVNVATLTYQTTDTTPVTITIDDDAQTDMVEPQLAMTKSNNIVTPIDAGATVTYTLTLSHTALSTAAAFDIEVDDTLPNNAGVAVVTAPVINTAASTCDDSGRTLGVTFADPTATFTLDELLLGDTCTIVYTVTVNDLAYANATYSNSATAIYTTIPGSDPNERIEPPIGPVTSDFTTPDPTMEKTLTATSLASTPGNNLTIGETATYTIVYTFTEGTTRNVTLIDSLPRIDNEGAALGFVSANITAVGAGITAPAFTLPQVAVLSDSALDADAVNDTATWALGNVVSTGDNVANSTITVTVVARVLDVADNVGLVTGQDLNLTNTATLTYTDGDDVLQTLDDTADINLVEPQVALEKAISTATTTVEIGSTVTYTLTLDHTAQSTANAYDLTITDVLPTEGGVVVVDYVTFDAATSTCDNGGRTLTDSYTAPTVTFTLSSLDLPDTCTIVYTVTVNADAVDGETYSNLAQVASVTTIPGSDPDERIEPPTPTDSTDFTVSTATIDKVVTSTNQPSTGNGSDADADLTIGEEVTYTVTVTMPDGVRNVVTVRDDLPVAGVQFEFVSATLTAVGADLSGAGLVIGTAGVLSDEAGAVGVNDRATWALGTVTNATDTGGTVAVDNQLVFVIVARVSDVSANVGLLPTPDMDAVNVATLTYETPDTTPVVITIDDDAQTDMVEPELALDKTAPVDTAVLGDIVTYTVVVTHTANSTADAFNLVVTDPLTPGLALVPGSVTAATSGAGTVVIVTGNGGADTSVRVDLDVLAMADILTITYDAEVVDPAESGDILTNIATVDANSLPDGTGRPLEETDDHDLEIREPDTFKQVVATSLADTGDTQYTAADDLTIGETATFHIHSRIPEGTYPLTITDQLPDVLEVVSSRVVSIGANISGSTLAVNDPGTASDTNADLLNDFVTFNFGTITNFTDNVEDDSDLVVVEVIARVIDLPANADGQTKTNTAVVDYSTGSDTVTEDVDIVEPLVGLTKTFDTALVAVSEPFTLTLVVTNIGTATAYDLALSDVFDPRLELLSAPVVDLSAAPGTIQLTDTSVLGLGGTIAFTFDQLLVGETITVTAEVSIDVEIAPVPQTVPNTATVISDTIPTGHPDDGFDRETTVPATDEVTGTHPTIEIVKLAEQGTVIAGSDIDYTITITNTGDPAVNANGVVLVDTLPDFTTLVSVASSQGTCEPGGTTTVVCDIGTIAPGDEVVVTLRVKTNGSTPDGFSAVNTAVVTTDETVEEEDSATTTVNQLPVASPTQAPAECRAGCQQIGVYHTNRDGNWEIYRLNTLTGQSNVQSDPSENLTRNSATDLAPSLSPDSRWFAFSSNRDGNWEIYIAPTSGDVSQTRRVTFNTVAGDTDPVWGPGNVLVYESSRHGNWELYAFDLETGIETRLTENDASDINAFWSDDGAKILFQSDRSGAWQLYELTLVTAALRTISDGSAQDVSGAYNAAGNTIAFTSLDADGLSTVMLMNADGSNRRAISDTDGSANGAVWSPAGDLLAYQSDLDGDLDIYIYQLSSGLTRKLTDNTVADYAPTWLCGTTDLIWTSEEAGNPDIFRAAALGIDSAPIVALDDAAHLTDDAADDVYVESAPNEENASLEGRLPMPVPDAAVHPQFINPQIVVTPFDPGLARESWATPPLCDGVNLATADTSLDPNLYPVE